MYACIYIYNTMQYTYLKSLKNSCNGSDGDTKHVIAIYTVWTRREHICDVVVVTLTLVGVHFQLLPLPAPTYPWVHVGDFFVFFLISRDTAWCAYSYAWNSFSCHVRTHIRRHLFVWIVVEVTPKHILQTRIRRGKGCTRDCDCDWGATSGRMRDRPAPENCDREPS